MRRFEFLEIIIRASFGKYIAAKILDDSSDSVQKLLDDVIVPQAPPETRIIPNDFRRERMYTPEMEVQVRAYALLRCVAALLNAVPPPYRM